MHEPNEVELWNKRHFEEKRTDCVACLKYSVRIFVEKYLKCSVWRLAVRYDPYMGRSAPKVRNLRVNIAAWLSEQVKHAPYGNFRN
jgi:hypothetical protein